MIKSYTSLEQSRKLAEILPLESADMCYRYYSGGMITGYGDCVLAKSFITGKNAIREDDLPCWSLAAFLNILPKPKIYYSTDKTNRWYCECWDNDGNFITFTKAINPVDACYEMIIKLKELNLL